MRILWLILWMIAAAPAAGDDAGPIAAWAVDGDLIVWRDGETEIVATGDVLAPYLAPGGQRIAFTRGADGLPESLWLLDEGDTTRLDVLAIVGQVVWQDATTLLVNTQTLTGLGPTPNDDLYIIDATTREVTPGAVGGAISAGFGAAVVIQAGDYGGDPGGVFTLEGERLLAFDAVATGSHTRFYPSPGWIDAETLRLALPDADALYAETGADPPPVALWRVSLATGDATQTGEVPASLFGLPRWSGERLIYAQRIPGAFRVWVDDAPLYETAAPPQVVTLAGDLTLLIDADGVQRLDPRETLAAGTPLTVAAGESHLLVALADDDGIHLRLIDAEGRIETLAVLESAPRVDLVTP